MPDCTTDEKVAGLYQKYCSLWNALAACALAALFPNHSPFSLMLLSTLLPRSSFYKGRDDISKHFINNTNNEEIQELAIKGNRKELDYLIGDIANEIGSLNSEITASNFAKAKNLDRLSSNDVAASITNMIGEVIGTVAYLNAMLCNEWNVL